MLYPLCYKLFGKIEHKVSRLGFIICTIFAIPLCFKSTSAYIAVVCLSLIYASVSVINTSFLSIFPVRFTESGNVASVSGIMDFATYSGAGIGSVIYGLTIQYMGYNSMFISWSCISIFSIIMLSVLIKHNKA